MASDPGTVDREDLAVVAPSREQAAMQSKHAGVRNTLHAGFTAARAPSSPPARRDGGSEKPVVTAATIVERLRSASAWRQLAATRLDQGDIEQARSMALIGAWAAEPLAAAIARLQPQRTGRG